MVIQDKSKASRQAGANQPPQLPKPVESITIQDTLTAFSKLEGELTKQGKPLLEKFDLSQHFGSKDTTLKHIRNLQKATHVVEGNLEELERISERQPHHRYPLNPSLFTSSIACCRENLINPALHANFFDTDLEHTRDALSVLHGWARITRLH